ncbi:MAG: putative oxidoreductase [Myxococcales bacterium]|nr:putative oxidoreductase [Myxococcales bacterium]
MLHLRPVWTRRRFLRAGIIGGILLGGAAVVGRSVSGYHVDAAIARRLRVLSPKEYLIMQAVARRVMAPDDGGAPTADQVEVALAVDAYLTKVPPAVVRDVRALLQLVEHGSSLFRFGGTRFSHLAADEQDATLHDWARSSLTVRRRGFQALRTLSFLGYYRDDRTWSLLGYSGPMLPRRAG